jgi:hypothetical protein
MIALRDTRLRPAITVHTEHWISQHQPTQGVRSGGQVTQVH